MLWDKSATGFRKLLPAILLAAGLSMATCAVAQDPLTQLIAAKPKPAQNTPAPASTPAVPPSNAQAVPAPSAPQVIPLPEVATQLEQLTQTLINLSASLPPDDQMQALSNAISSYGAAIDAKRKEA